LHISNATAANLRLQDTTTNVYTNIWQADNGSTSSFLVDVDPNNVGSGGCPLVINTAGSTKLTLTSSGNLGLGVTPSAWSAGKAIEVGAVGNSIWGNGAVNMRILSNAYFASGAFRYATSAVASQYAQDNGTHAWSIAPSWNGTGSDAISFTQAMTLDASGRLLVGNTADAASGGYFGAIQAQGSYPALVLKGTEASAKTWQVAENAGALAFYNTTDGERARITSGGNFLINTTSSIASTLISKGTTSNNTASACHFMNSSDAALFFVRNDGYIETGTAATSPYNNTTGSAANMFVDSAGGLSRSTSSIRYKIDIKNATHGLAEVLALRPVTYKGINDKDKVFGGLIAEEVHDIGLTEFVAYNNANEPDALHYGNMVALLTKAIQEQQAIITQLTARVAQLESK
jgi:hypothetical protein